MTDEQKAQLDAMKVEHFDLMTQIKPLLDGFEEQRQAIQDEANRVLLPLQRRAGKLRQQIANFGQAANVAENNKMHADRIARFEGAKARAVEANGTAPLEK